jgi:hypothetical protein
VILSLFEQANATAIASPLSKSHTPLRHQFCMSLNMLAGCIVTYFCHDNNQELALVRSKKKRYNVQIYIRAKELKHDDDIFKGPGQTLAPLELLHPQPQQSTSSEHPAIVHIVDNA